MNDEHLTLEEKVLTQRLRSLSPHPLRASARAAIREQMMSEFRVQIDAPPYWQPVVHRPNTRHTTLLRTAGLVAALGIAVAVFFLQNWTRQTASTSTAVPATDLQPITLVPTSTPTLTPMPENTPTPEVQQIIPATPLPFTLVPSNTFTPTATPTTPLNATEAPTAWQTIPSGSGIVVVEGPVSAINGNRVTIYSFVVEVAPQDPLLAALAVGDTVHVEGSLTPAGVMIASTIGRFVNPPPASGAPGAATLNGHVEAIDGSQLVVNSVPVRLTPGDPILQRLKVGDLVEMWGNFAGSGAESVFVPLYMTIANPTPVYVPPANNGASSGGAPPPPPNNPPGMGMGDDDGMGMGRDDDDG
jgi:hypothetical protein